MLPSGKQEDFDMVSKREPKSYLQNPSLEENLSNLSNQDMANDNIFLQDSEQSLDSDENISFQVKTEKNNQQYKSRHPENPNKKQPKIESSVSFTEKTKSKKKTQQLAKNRNPTFMQTILVHLFASVLLEIKEKLKTKSLSQIKKSLKSKYRTIHKILMSNSTSEVAFKKLLNSKLSKDQEQNEKLWSEILNENRIYQIIEELDIKPENQAVREYYFWFTPILKEMRKKENANVKILELEKRYQSQLNSKRRKELDKQTSLRDSQSTAHSDSPELLIQQIPQVSELGLTMRSMHEMDYEFFYFPHEIPTVKALDAFQNEAQASTSNNQNSTTTRSQSQNFGINNTSLSQIGNDCNLFIDQEMNEEFYRLEYQYQVLAHHQMQLE